MGDCATLVQHEPGPDATSLEFGDRLAGRDAGHLLVTSEREPHVLCRRETQLEQRLDRLADGDQSTLVVEGASPPDQTVDEVGAERCVLPRVALLNRHDIE